MAAATFAGSELSTNVAATPKRAYSFSRMVRLGPYRASVATMCVPCPRKARYTMFTAAMPLAAASPPQPCSSSAMLFSSASIVGLPRRVYL